MILFQLCRPGCVAQQVKEWKEILFPVLCAWYTHKNGMSFPCLCRCNSAVDPKDGTFPSITWLVVWLARPLCRTPNLSWSIVPQICPFLLAGLNCACVKIPTLSRELINKHGNKVSITLLELMVVSWPRKELSATCKECSFVGTCNSLSKCKYCA